MDQKGSHLWLIPVVIIGFNCLVFVCLIMLGYKKDTDRKAAEAAEAAETATVQETTGAEETVSSDSTVSKGGTQLDESFYDEEAIEENIYAYSSGYVLLLTSSESDLKIQMVKEDGSPASGTDWKAVVKGRESGESFTAEDDDEDGMIYVDEVEAGDYEVEVSDGTGISETSVISVKPRIRYTASSGIRSIVMQESQIDAAAEDTALTSEDKENEGEFKGIDLPQGTRGIDVSKYNKEIDWVKVRNSGIEFAIIRVGYRGSGSGVLVEDPFFRQNLAGAKAAGLKIGVYFFTQAISTEEAAEEAEAVASLVNASDLALPVYLDVESSGNANGGRADGLDTATRTEIVKCFCETAQSLGYRAGVYANKTWMTSRLNMEELAPYEKWLAQYRTAGPTYTGDYSMWQYTSNGSVDGIQGRVDLDIMVR